MVTVCAPFALISSAHRRPSLGHFMATLRQSFSYEEIWPESWDLARM